MNTPNIPYTTLKRIRKHSPGKSLWEALLKALNKTQADDEPLTYLYLASLAEDDKKILSVVDVLWCCRAEPKYEQIWFLCATSFCGGCRDLIFKVVYYKEFDIALYDTAFRAADKKAEEAATKAMYLKISLAWFKAHNLDVGKSGQVKKDAYACAKIYQDSYRPELESVKEDARKATKAKQLQIFKQMVS
jgi:hypothetical protein